MDSGARVGMVSRARVDSRVLRLSVQLRESDCTLVGVRTQGCV